MDVFTDSDSSDHEPETQFSTLIQSLINSGQLDLMTSDFLDSYYCPKIPKIKNVPDTAILDKTEFYLSTKLASGLGQQKKILQPHHNISYMLMNRERGVYPYNKFSNPNKRKLNNRYLPNTITALDKYSGKVFCGVFSKNGEYFITASQDCQIRVYKSSDPLYKLCNTFKARDVGWSIIDVAFSPDKQHFVYSTWSSSLHLCSVEDSASQIPLLLLNTGRRFCVFSVVFSSDGRQLLGGANDGCLYIYDQRSTRTTKIPAHEYDVNTVAFADNSSHIIYSGGDDGIIKVWDRRTMDESTPNPVGVLAGHMDGVTFIDSRGDSRHLISNSKDQTIKLWDVRVFSDKRAAEKSLRAVNEQTWDYRWQQVPVKLFSSKNKLEGDTSIMTYRGHVVIKTLIRCKFSPLETTGQRYIYTGSGTGGLIIYDALTGRIEEVVHGHIACVRDVAWHPYRSEILTASWDGTVGLCTYSNKQYNYPCEMETDCSISDDELVPIQPLRRSKRIALRKTANRN